MSQLYDDLREAIQAFEVKGGKADSIVLTPADHAELRKLATLDTGDRRLGDRFMDVRVYEGQPFDHSYVEGHDYRKQPSKILLRT